uniref:ZMYM2-like/QRICH1 C-terminal domain-containing protein n=2 Tax=Apteryx owenii TaxID=8824 RepID=A0A8B9SAV5_APTOW
MDENVGDRKYSDVSSVRMDLSNLVTWAHTHGTICNQIPTLESMQNMGHPSKDNSVLWICGVGHAYHWPGGKLCLRSREEKEAVEERKRSISCETSSGEPNLAEKRFRVTPSFEGAKADSVTTGSCSRSPGVTQKKDNTVYVMDEAPTLRKKRGLITQKNSKSMRSCSAAEQHFPEPDGEVKTDLHKVKLESNEDLQIISDEEQLVSDAENQTDRINWNTLSELQIKEVTAEVELQMHRNWKTAINTQPATHTSGSAPMEKPQLTPCLQETLEDINQKSLESSWKLLPLNPAESKNETSKAGNSSGSAISKEHFKSVPVSDVEAKAQRESPASVTFFEFEATVDVQQQLQLSSPERGTSEISLIRNFAEIPIQEAKPLGSQHAPHVSASLSPENKNSDHPPVSSDKNVLRKWESKRSRNAGDIKMFRDWLVLHFPSETREIFVLPPEDLDNYLASFYSNAKKQDGTEFSASSLYFFQSGIDRYLKDHKYEYNVVRGLEFRASQEALKQKCQQLTQKGRERDWHILENLTDKDVESLHKKGILSHMHPEGFLHLMLINIIRGFGANTHNQSHNLYWGQLMLKKNEEGLEYLEWKDALDAEVNTGESAARVFANPDNPNKCPVRDYKEYAKRRPLDMLHDHDPLYLCPKPLCSVWDQIWYCRKSLTKAKMEKIMKVIIQQVKGTEKKPKK